MLRLEPAPACHIHRQLAIEQLIRAVRIAVHRHQGAQLTRLPTAHGIEVEATRVAVDLHGHAEIRGSTKHALEV